MEAEVPPKILLEGGEEALPLREKRASEAKPWAKSHAREGRGRHRQRDPSAKSIRSARTPRPAATLNWSTCPCLEVGSSVIAATKTSPKWVRAPRCGASAAKDHAGRLSYIRQRVPSMGSKMHRSTVRRAGVPAGNVVAPSANPSITVSTGQSRGQYRPNQSRIAASPIRSTR